MLLALVCLGRHFVPHTGMVRVRDCVFAIFERTLYRPLARKWWYMVETVHTLQHTNTIHDRLTNTTVLFVLEVTLTGTGFARFYWRDCTTLHPWIPSSDSVWFPVWVAV